MIEEDCRCVEMYANMKQVTMKITATAVVALLKKVDEQLTDDGKIIPKEKIDLFHADNSWNKFANNISNLLK